MSCTCLPPAPGVHLAECATRVAPYGDCPKCKRNIQLTPEGKLRSHGTITLGGSRGYRPCKGSFTVPK